MDLKSRIKFYILILFCLILISFYPHVVFAQDWVSPIGFEDAYEVWYNEDLAFDSNTDTSCITYIPSMSCPMFVRFFVPNVKGTKIRIFLETNSSDMQQLGLTVYVEKDETYVKIADFNISHPEHYGWNEFEYEEGIVTTVQIRFCNWGDDEAEGIINEIEVYGEEQGGYGQWFKQYERGFWTTCTRTHWVSTDDDFNKYDGEAQWFINLQNFTGYSANLTKTVFDTKRKWWWQQAYNQVHIYYAFKGSDDSNITGYMRFSEREWLFGIIKGDTQLEARGNNTEVGFGGVMDGETAKFQVWRDGNFLNMRVLADRDVSLNMSDPPLALINVNYEVASSWFENVTITLTVIHKTFAGNFDISVTDFYKENDEWYPSESSQPYHIITIWDLIYSYVTETVYNALPPNVREWVDLISSWFDTFFAILTTIWNMGLNLVALLPLFLFFWFVDSIGTAIYSGELNRMGICVSTMYNAVRSTVNLIVNVIATIWNFIHFW